VLQLPVTANVAVSSPILLTLIMEAIRSSETSVLTRTTRRHIPKDDILQSVELSPIRCSKKLNVTLNDVLDAYQTFSVYLLLKFKTR
jgi:hypothetical protein